MSAVQELTHAQRERLAFIDFSLQYFGHVARTDLIQRFKTGLAASTRDFTMYKELAPYNLELCHSTKSYHRLESFKALFRHDPAVILTSLSRGFGNGISDGVQPSEQCVDATGLIHPDADTIAALMRAIHNRQPLRCHYYSLSSGETQRVIVPHALVNNGHRWHVRAFDRKQRNFRDFVCTRFSQVSLMSDEVRSHETGQYDDQWQQQVSLILVPHPSLRQPKAVELDYGMQGKQLVINTRAALAAYLLRYWQVDCSAQYAGGNMGYQLALANPEVLKEITNTSLAPNYQTAV